MTNLFQTEENSQPGDSVSEAAALTDSLAFLQLQTFSQLPTAGKSKDDIDRMNSLRCKCSVNLLVLVVCVTL